ncbi:flagellar hook protein FlgE [Parvibaculum sp.]|uniref:flagellar hook protein FlgE n=1 Tax=Parvibaculum sp. TaxID=2024848 RepID=UPI0027316BC1|nr:flagellar hook protein FlgE [Parvibaculum sp.]MDP1627093.1 flagellar hook protein FlgE [Parvibaculum sp.]MDP2149316.1 flagellar hook protein FlgE [Parvibaculum sp.]MDP3328114.1 flagellar hook protein FlgE [Parvibaculum sp.]
MSFFGSMTTAITGIRAQSSALGHISDNIANSQTVGFKRTDTSFQDIVTASTSRNHLPGAVLAAPSFTNSVQGSIDASEVPTHMAINGEGFFIVSARVATVDGNPVFDNVNYYTRRGDFTMDKYGYLVNGGGYTLQGLQIDPVTGNPVGDVPGRIQINRDFLAARTTTTISYKANLPAWPKTNNADPDIANSELLTVGRFTPALADLSVISAANEDIFLDNSLSGGAVTGYDALGAPANVQFRWAKVDNADGGGDTWNLFYKTDDSATGAADKWVNVGQDYAFDAQGRLTPAVDSTTITGLTVNGVALGNVTLDHGASNITQFEDNNGTVKTTALDQNGYPSGELVAIAVSENGRVTGTYSNGKTVDIAQVSLATFNAADKLKKLDGTAFAATQESGEPMLGAGGDIIASAREASNVDIADEFSKLIVTQQAYTAGTRIVTTADELIRETLNMKR